MPEQIDDRKVHSTDIVNGLARKDIFDSKGVLLVKEGTRVSEAHYDRMREEGLVFDEQNDASKNKHKFDINFVSANSLHGRLEKQVSLFAQLQTKMLDEASSELTASLDEIITNFTDLCNENIHQVLGELYLSEAKKYHYIKPLYIAASLIELVNRFNQYAPDKAISEQKRVSLVRGALTYNLGLIKEKDIYQSDKELSEQERIDLRKRYPKQSISILKKMGIEDKVTIDVIKRHNTVVIDPTFDALLLRTPFIYAGISLPESKKAQEDELYNPGKEFTRLYAMKKLDEVLGGLFLKINGVAPIGAILNFETREKGVIIKGPKEDNVTSSLIRIITNKVGVQLNRPGERFHLHEAKIQAKGLSDHHQFAWSKFNPFVVWER